MNTVVEGESTDGYTTKVVDLGLSQLRIQTVEMGALVIDQVSKAVNALLTADEASAEVVLSREPIVNSSQLSIDQHIFEFIAW